MMQSSLFDSIFKDTTDFQPYTLSHYLAVFISFLLGVILITWAKKKWTEEQQYQYAIYVAGFLFLFQISKIVIRYFLGNFDVTTDLPLHLCNILPFLLFIALKLRSKWIFGIIFFWIMGGTLQANFTPTLKDVFPHYEFFRYWVIHMGLPIMAVYSVICFRWKLTFSDAIRSALGMNTIGAFIYPINILLGSNYLYLVAKPNGKTVYDLLGPWPIYLFNIEMLMVVLFPLLAIPFLFMKNDSKNSLS